MSHLDALHALATGDARRARQLVIESLRADRYDRHAWTLLAHLAHDDEERALCLQRVEQTEQRYRACATPPSEYQPLEIAVAAVNKESYPEAVRSLSLREPLRLRREPGNRFDPNAILVERLNGQPCGYVPRLVAAVLAPEMDIPEAHCLHAFVTQLATTYYGDTLSLKVAIALPAEVRTHIRQTLTSPADPQLSYAISRTDHYAYIVLNCSERRLQLVVEALEEEGFPIRLPPGPSTRVAANGRTYRWFVRVEPESGWGEAEIQQFFKAHFNLLSDDERDRRAAEEQRRLRASIAAMEQGEDALLRELRGAKADLEALKGELGDATEITQFYATENQEKKNEIARLENMILNRTRELKDSQREREGVQRQLDELTATVERPIREDNELARVVRQLFPELVWLRESLAVLTENFLDPLPALTQIHIIACDRAAVSSRLKPKGLQKAKGWWELHLSTGQSHDGRLYFRHSGPQTQLLISFKRSQDHDIAWLCRQ